MSAAGLGFEPSQNNAFRERRATTTLARIIFFKTDYLFIVLQIKSLY